MVKPIHLRYNISEDYIGCACNKDQTAADVIIKDDCIIIYEEQLKVGLWFPLTSFYVDVLRLICCSVAQLHPNAWRILIAFRSLCHQLNL